MYIFGSVCDSRTKNIMRRFCKSIGSRKGQEHVFRLPSLENAKRAKGKRGHTGAKGVTSLIFDIDKYQKVPQDLDISFSLFQYEFKERDSMARPLRIEYPCPIQVHHT